MLESHVDAVEDALQFATRTMRTPRPFALRWRDGQTINVEILANESGIQVFGLPNHNRPGTTDEWEANLASVGQQTGAALEFEVTARRRFQYRSARVGWLKSAYLVAFAALGYSYILLPQLETIREQIAKPAEQVIEGFTAFRSNGSIADRALLLIDQPEVALAVVMGYHIVLLPSDDSPDGLYDRLGSNIGDGRFEAHPIGEVPWPRTLLLAMDFASDDAT